MQAAGRGGPHLGLQARPQQQRVQDLLHAQRLPRRRQRPQAAATHLPQQQPHSGRDVSMPWYPCTPDVVPRFRPPNVSPRFHDAGTYMTSGQLHKSPECLMLRFESAELIRHVRFWAGQFGKRNEEN